METEHTPAPWSVNPQKQWSNGNKVFEINFGEDGEVIGEGVYTKADAQLIAAAPDLLEALKTMIDFSNTWGKEWFSNEQWQQIENAKNAYNKALGKEATNDN